jgi:hypothetical protein
MGDSFPLALLEGNGVLWTVPVMGLAIGVLALLVGRWMIRTPHGKSPPLDPGLLPEEEKDADKWGDRRSSPRRAGNLTEVDLEYPPGVSGPSIASILDRSTGGLCLLVSEPMPTGGVIQIKARRNPGFRFAVSVEVRGCRRTEDGWRVNCRFLRQLTYNELVMLE